jgi:ABC-type ATPase with predicted acetyltransferase domain
MSSLVLRLLLSILTFKFLHMPTYSVEKSFHFTCRITDRVTQVCRMFGLTADRLAERTVTHSCQLTIEPDQIVYITGPSGAGKSVLLREFEDAVPTAERINLNQIPLSDDRTVIDCFDGDLLMSLRLLSIAGLNDVFCILNQPVNLSEGQKWRFRLAKALAAKKKVVFADEFCSTLDRVTAAVISHNLYKFAKRTGTGFFLASSQDDILLDLQPDVLVIKELSGPTQVIYKYLAPK